MFPGRYRPRNLGCFPVSLVSLPCSLGSSCRLQLDQTTSCLRIVSIRDDKLARRLPLPLVSAFVSQFMNAPWAADRPSCSTSVRRSGPWCGASQSHTPPPCCGSLRCSVPGRSGPTCSVSCDIHADYAPQRSIKGAPSTATSRLAACLCPPPLAARWWGPVDAWQPRGVGAGRTEVSARYCGPTSLGYLKAVTEEAPSTTTFGLAACLRLPSLAARW